MGATDQPLPQRTQFLKRNIQWAKDTDPSKWYTPLTPREEQLFRSWVSRTKVPFDPNEKYPDYDLRGYFKGVISGDKRAVRGLNPKTGTYHFPDTWKTPYHESFSNESIYANPKTAPSWKGSSLVAPTGQTIYQETPGK